MSETLYRKYRSKKLSEIVGQSHITDILTRSLERGIISQAYLLTGPHGVGKTSIARILAHEINKLPYTDDSTYLDIIEIDAASNNSVEDIRDLREKARVAPTSASKKIYVIDEVHMLSKAAFNALLKTLEEPPEHVVFILATTDANKLPDTIISRTQRFSFRAISDKDAVDHLTNIAKKEKIVIEKPALELIASHGNGSFRDSISLLDQLRSLTTKDEPISRQLVERVLGLAPQEFVENILDAHKRSDLKGLLTLLDQSDERGVPPALLARQITQAIRASISSDPPLLPLLDQLLEVGKSSDPRTKLLTVLASGMTPRPKTAALSVATPVHETPIRVLELEATKPHPKVPKSPPAPAKKIVAAGSQPATNFNWQSLVDGAKQDFVALYSVLNKCSGVMNGNELTIYARNTFYKKKLDDPKYRKRLITCVEALELGDISIETLPTTAPLKDSQTAAVAAIMGGGEEVVLDD